MIDKVIIIWLDRQEKSAMNTHLLKFYLSPNPVIMKDASGNNTEEHNKAIKRMISNLFIDYSLVGQAWVEARDDLVDSFWNEYSDLNLRTKNVYSPVIWDISEFPGTLAREWYNNSSVVLKKVLRNLACIVTSKILGIGSAERHWK